MRLINVFFLIIFSFSSIAQEELKKSDYRLFDPIHDGAWFPVQLYVNGSFDVIQNPYWFDQKDYWKKHKEVWDEVKNPFKSIKNDGGWGEFFKEEFLSDRVLPNIFLHTFGSAYEVNKLMEYADYYDIKWAKFWTFATIYAMHFGNEANETRQEEVKSFDHIADLYFFDVAGLILGMNDTFMDFMVYDMGMTTWHFMPVYDIEHEDFFNVGLNYVFRPEMLQFSNIRPLLYLGMMNMGGLTFDSGDLSHSIVAGLALTDPLERKGRFVYGYYLETMGRQSASLLLNGSEDFRVRLNLYPALFRYYGEMSQNLALMLGQTKNDDFAFGINYELPISIGLLDY